MSISIPACSASPRERIPGVALHVGDMRTFDLGRSFDVVTCLFSSIGYVTEKEEMDQAISNMARHLNPGGVLIVEPWLSPDQWDETFLGGTFVDEPDLKIARFNLPTRHGDLTPMEMHYLVMTSEGIDYFVELHRTRLYDDEDYIDAFRKAGLEVEQSSESLMERSPRGLFIGVRPAE